MARFETLDEVRYDGIPPFKGYVVDYEEDHTGPRNDLVDDEERTGPAFAVLSDLVNEANGTPIVVWVWADDQCLVSSN